ncbi:MAG: crotonase/enoyl-CoA hydratase family protein [Pseudomonadota bacterium]
MSDIEIGREGRVQTIRFNRPEKKNAITRAMYREMADALNGANDDDDIAVTLIMGTGGIFTSGNDLADFIAVAAGGEQPTDVHDYLKAMANAKKPFIAAVDGLAVGVGTTTLMHCDLVYASPQAWFQTPFLDLGLVPEAGSSLIASRIMGHQMAYELLVLGERWSAERAEKAGLVNTIVEADRLEAHAMEQAQRLAAKPPQALKLSHDLMRNGPEDIVERIQHEGQMFADRLKSDEARAAFLAFMNRKRA